MITSKLAEFLGGDSSEYNTEEPLISFGLDSLSTMELLEWIKNDIGVEIQPNDITDDTSVDSLFVHISSNFEPVRQELVRQEPIRQEYVRQEPIRQEYVRQEPIRQESIRQDNNILSDSESEVSCEDIHSESFSTQNVDNDIDFLNDRYSIYKLWSKKNKYINSYLNTLNN